VEEKTGGLAAGAAWDPHGPAYQALTTHMFRPPKYTSADGERVVSVVPGMDHSQWVALEALVFEAIAAPIKASNDRKEADSATKKAAAKAKKEERLAKGEPKMMDVVGSYNGLYAGGGFPERVLQVEQTAERAVKETAERRQQRQASKKSKVLADLVGARKRIEDGGKPFPTFPQMRAVVLAYRKHKEVSETTLNDLSKLMKSLPSTKPEYDLVLTEAGDEGIL